MAASVTGTHYIHHLDHIRLLRDRQILGRMGALGGAMTDVYYMISSWTINYVKKSKTLRYVITHLIVRPVGRLAKEINGRRGV